MSLLAVPLLRHNAWAESVTVTLEGRADNLGDGDAAWSQPTVVATHQVSI